MTDPPDKVDTRLRALYAPTEEQSDDKEVLDFIQQRVLWKGKPKL